MPDGDALRRPRLIRASLAHVDTLMTWFDDAVDVTTFGGPRFRFPFTRASFIEDLEWSLLDSFALVAPDGTLIAFGQLYHKNGRGHLARLAVAPARRGRGYGSLLVESLMTEARRRFRCSEYSLYVLRSNARAVGCYRKAGFEPAPVPVGDIEYPDQVFMIRR